MATTWPSECGSFIWYYGNLVMWSLIKNVSRITLIYHYRWLIARCFICFAIFAVIELLFTRWQMVIEKLDTSTQSTILGIYSLIQLILLVLVIFSLTRTMSDKSQSSVNKQPNNSASGSPPIRSRNTAKSSHNPSDKVNQLDEFLDTKQYPDLSQFNNKD